MDSASSFTNLSSQHRLRELLLGFGTAIWRVLANPYGLLAISVIALLLVLLGLFVPQMPDQFNTDPAAAARWKLGVVAAYGTLAGPLEVLGIFNVVQSVLLRILMIMIVLMIAVQLAVQLGLALAFRRLPEVLDSPVGGAGIPLNAHYSGPLIRDLGVSEEPIDELVTTTADALAADYGDVRRQTTTLTSTEQPESVVTEDAASKIPAEIPSNETRFLALSHQRLIYLRPLLPLSLLLALAGLWLNAAFGWEIISPSLSPTERFRHPPQQLEISYPPIISDGGSAPAIHINLADTQQTIAVGDSVRLGGTTVITRESAPALLVRAEPAGVQLSRLGETASIENRTADEPMVLGLEFPEPGREEVLILPDLATGVRVVRLPNNTYSIELYEAGGTEPIKRYSLDSDDGLLVDLPDSDVVLTFFPSIGAVTAVRSASGRWLFWPALLFFVVGLAGFVRNPVFLLAQIAPWSSTKRVIISQSNSNVALNAYRAQQGSTEGTV